MFFSRFTFPDFSGPDTHLSGLFRAFPDLSGLFRTFRTFRTFPDQKHLVPHQVFRISTQHAELFRTFLDFPDFSGHFRTFPDISGLFQTFPNFSGHSGTFRTRNTPFRIRLSVAAHDFSNFPRLFGLSKLFRTFPMCFPNCRTFDTFPNQKISFPDQAVRSSTRLSELV